MKKIFLAAVVIGSVFVTRANELFDQLVAFNFNWANYEDRVPESEAVAFESDKEYIQKHLENVLLILKSNPTNDLSQKQLASRLHLIDVLSDYREAGVFPMNYYRVERLPVFIDEHGTHCAVGFLLRETGNEVVAQRIARKDNYAWVKDIDDPALPSWQQSSGFTMDELKLIQGAYDSYMPMAWLRPDKTEIPQKPEVIVRNFNGEETDFLAGTDLLTIWCYGEGADGVLNGKWIQNYRNGIPWIEGFYENGKRTGSWKEYYKGTNILCRTEHWRNDKLNGVRTRFDREGNVIERITFKDGAATQKINYDLQGNLEYIRIPIDSMTVKTQIFSDQGYLLAEGSEKIYNPSGLLWFQNIELTALNTMAITARDGAPEYIGNGGFSVISGIENGPGLVDFYRPQRSFISFQQPSLVQYLKFGTWKYYNEYTPETYLQTVSTTAEYIQRDYPHLKSDIEHVLGGADFKSLHHITDSLSIEFEENQVQSFTAYGTDFKVVLRANNSFSNSFPYGNPMTYVSALGEVNEHGYRYGEWYHFNMHGEILKREDYFIPVKPEEELTLNR